MLIRAITLVLPVLGGCAVWVPAGSPCDSGGDGFGYFLDADGDGFGDPQEPLDCTDVNRTLSYVHNSDDCDDAVSNNGGEQRIWYSDPDFDGYGTGEDCDLDDEGHWRGGEGCVEACAPPEGYGAGETGDCAPDNGTWSLVCPWVQVAAGRRHSCGLRADGEISCWGYPDMGPERTEPDFLAVTAGDGFTCGLHTSGEVECWGEPPFDEPSPPDGGFTLISAGLAHLCALDASGKAMCWGSPESDPPRSSRFTTLDAGVGFTCGVLTDNSILCWGAPPSGAADSEQEPFAGVAGGAGGACAIGRSGKVSCWGTDWSSPGGQDADASFIAIDAGYAYACGVRDDGTVACWGADILGDTLPPEGQFTSVSASESHTCGLRDDQAIECWGDDTRGMSTPPASAYRTIGSRPDGSCAATTNGYGCWGGHGETMRLSGRFPQMAAGEGHSCGLHADGRVECWGWDEWGQASPPADEDFTEVTAGKQHSCALRSDGRVTCWGDDDHGAANPPSDAFTEVSAGVDHTCGLLSDATVKCWGRGFDESTPRPSWALAALSARDGRTCGLLADGGVQCWGARYALESGAPADTDFETVSAGAYRACGLQSDGTVVCWRSDGYAMDPSRNGDFIQVEAGYYFTCGVHADGTVECWGDNNWHQIDRVPGDNDFKEVHAGLSYACGTHRDDTVECWGDNDLDKATPYDGTGVRFIQGGAQHVCALLDSGYVLCGGEDSYLPAAGVAEVQMSGLSVGRYHSCAITEATGEITCWGDNSRGQTDVPDGLLGARAIAAGGTFTCSLDAAGSPLCWGALAGSPEGFTGASVTAGYAHACGLDSEGHATCWGDDTYSQVSATPPDTFTALYAGGWTTCGLLADADEDGGHDVACWGDDSFGQVRDAPPYTRFTELAVGDGHVCGLKLDGLLTCWGSNQQGQQDWPLPNEVE